VFYFLLETAKAFADGTFNNGENSAYYSTGGVGSLVEACVGMCLLWVGQRHIGEQERQDVFLNLESKARIPDSSYHPSALEKWDLEESQDQSNTRHTLRLTYRKTFLFTFSKVSTSKGMD